jgi:hypothetical protein
MSEQQVWFDNPAALFKKDSVLNFWPVETQSPSERINTSTRFIIYSASVMYLIKRDPRVLVLAAMVIVVIYILHKGNMIKDGRFRPPYSQETGFPRECQRPTADNPMSNFLIGDDPLKGPACYYSTVAGDIKSKLDDTMPYDCGRSRCAMPSIQRAAAARQFVSNPVTTSVNDQTGFAEWCYGKKTRPTCKDDPSVCNPDMRGVQLEAFGGIMPSGNMRR